MAECIDRQVAVDALARLCKRVCQYSEKQRQYMCGACPLGDAFTVIEDDLPAADVRPVRFGKLEKYGAAIRCSVCGFDTQSWDVNFCPNCGADMRET